MLRDRDVVELAVWEDGQIEVLSIIAVFSYIALYTTSWTHIVSVFGLTSPAIFSRSLSRQFSTNVV